MRLVTYAVTYVELVSKLKTSPTSPAVHNLAHLGVLLQLQGVEALGRGICRSLWPVQPATVIMSDDIIDASTTVVKLYCC